METTTVSPQHLLAALDVFPTPAIVAFGNDGRAWINRALAKLANLPETMQEVDLDDLPYDMLVGGRLLSRREIPLSRALRGETFHQPMIIRPRAGSPVDLVAFAAPIRHDDGTIAGAIVTMFDVREQRRLEAEKLATQARLDKSADRLLYLARAGEALSESLNVEAVLSTLERLVVPRLAMFSFILLLDESGRPAESRMYHADQAQLRQLRAFVSEMRLTAKTFEPATRIAHTGVGEIIPSIAAELDKPSVPAPRRAWLQKILSQTQLRQSMGVPIRAHGVTLGVLFVSDRDEHAYIEEDLRVLEEVARRAASAIENAQSYERQQKALQMMQRALLPANLPCVDEFAFDVVYAPGDDEALIGGDWYDAFQVPDGRIVISIGDVTGRGLTAAVLMGKVRHSISAISYYETDPVKMLDTADATLRRRNDEVIVTAFVGVLDPKEQTFTFATAGHPPPFWKRSDGSMLMLPCHGLPLGVRTHDQASPVTVRLSHRDLLLLYTDGLTESTQDLIAGERRLRETLEQLPPDREKDAAGYVLEQMLPNGSRDDVAILSVQVCGKREEAKNALELSFDARDLRMAHEARRVFVAFLRELGDPESDFDGAELVFGELVGNVVRHAPGEIRVVCRWENGFPTLAVHDRGRGVYDGAPNLPRDPLSESGRGLFLVNALTRDFKVQSRADGGMEARAVLNVPSRPRLSSADASRR